MFSSRVPVHLDPNPLARAVQELRAAGRPFIDLTVSNPTEAGFSYPEGLLAGLSGPPAYVYAPHPLGLAAAREAVAADYARRGLTVSPSRIVLTASTSESYSFLFRLLCAPGDDVLVPRPSYPLFEFLTELDGIEGRPYRLGDEGTWSLDVSAVASAASSRTRGVVVVAPNNPTGSRVDRDALIRLAALCAARHLAIIGDEVFADYELEPAPAAAASVLEANEALTFSLGGLSKSVGLPQLKLGWIAVGGPPELVDEALARLEVIGDAYLSVSGPVQAAAAQLLAGGAEVRRQIAARVLLNYGTLKGLAAEYPACRLPPLAGGWSAVVQGPAVMSDDLRALDLLMNHGVLAHPGYLFDFERDGYFVVSLLPRPDDFRTGIRRLLDGVNGT
jgi:aspartate/methionine/tyrosine aminotransferase